MRFTIRFFYTGLFLFMLGSLTMPFPLYAHDALPDVIQAQLTLPLQKVGSGTYRKFGFTIYHVTLWAPDGKWSVTKPHALELHYTRSLSKDTLADSIIDDIHDQNVADDATLAQWSIDIKKAMPAVEDGDVMIGAVNPGGATILYLNGNEIAHINDQKLTQAFFNIWLGEDADEGLKKDLLAQAE